MRVCVALIAMRVCVALALAAALAAAPALPACAAPTPPAALPAAAPAGAPTVHLTRAQAADFPAALAELARQGRVALVAEGAPLTPRLALDKSPDLTAATPLAKAVATLAAAYDYDARRTEGGVFVLTKRYTDVKDLPCVTLPECLQAAQDVISVLDTFNPHFDESGRLDGADDQRDTVINFANSLSLAQLQALDNKALRYGDLSPDQQALIRNLFLYQYVQGPSETMRNAVTTMQTVAHSVLTGQNAAGVHVLCAEMPVLPGTIEKDSPDGRHYLMALGTAQTAPAMILPPAPPPAAGPGPSTLGPSTLAALVAGLGPIAGIRPAVEASLRDKPVTAAGLANAPAEEVLHGLEALYGLRIGVSDAGGDELERLPAPVPASLSDISADVWAALPPPLVRALHVNEAVPEVPKPSGTDAQALFQYQIALQKRQQQQWAVQAGPARLAAAGLRQLLVDVQPQLRAGGLTARIPVASLDAPAQQALAVALFGGMVGMVYNSYAGQPNKLVLDCLDNINQMVIYSRPQDTATIMGRLIPSIQMESHDPYTHQLVTMGGITYVSHP